MHRAVAAVYCANLMFAVIDYRVIDVVEAGASCKRCVREKWCKKVEINSTSYSSQGGKECAVYFSEAGAPTGPAVWPGLPAPAMNGFQLELTPLATGLDAAEGALAAAATLEIRACVAATPIERVVQAKAA